MNLDPFLIQEDAPLREALQKISKNNHGFIVVTEANGTVVGVATDGDIRQHLVQGAAVTDAIGSFANRDFIWADAATPREVLLKQLDHHIRVIPLLDSARHLAGVVSKDHFPAREEAPVYARARAPVRVSFGGGGSDVTRYFADGEGAVINTTISLYGHATMRVRNDKKVIVESQDLGERLAVDNLHEAFRCPGRFGLILALLRAVHPEYGFELYLHSDFPMGSGLGGSAVISAAVLGCFNQFRRDKWNPHELAELAFQAERLYLGVAGGWQDQYATVFGGFNFMEFRMDQNVIHPLRIHRDILNELEESLVLCDTGAVHDSGLIHQDQNDRIRQAAVKAKVRSNVDLTYRMRNYLLRGQLNDFGQTMHDSWMYKRQFSDQVSNEKLDRLYEGALANGSLGGRLLGAGGGGFFLFYVPAFRKSQLLTYLEAEKLAVRPFRFEQEGLQSWSARENG